MELNLKVNSAEKTQIIGKMLGKLCQGGEVFCLEGELGSGKTTFTKGLGQGLGVREEISSPTFILERQYSTRGGLEFYHLDLYRLQDPQELEELNFFEIINNPKTVVAIEWPEMIKNFLDKNYCLVSFYYLGEKSRQVTLRGFGKKYEAILKKLKKTL
jgi:tRNA threonylcarbamoyladenosine biosynthesis protein TsaE